eukprot:13994622-Heterocapsa_arctica.AAC.1
MPVFTTVHVRAMLSAGRPEARTSSGRVRAGPILAASVMSLLPPTWESVSKNFFLSAVYVQITRTRPLPAVDSVASLSGKSLAMASLSFLTMVWAVLFAGVLASFAAASR